MKRFISRLAASVAVFVTILFTLNSCTKEKPLQPKSATDLFGEQALYTLDKATYNDAQVVNIISNQFGSSEPSPVIAAIHVNELGATAANMASSELTVKDNIYPQAQFIIEKMNDTILSLSFRISQSFAGNNNPDNRINPPYKLLNSNALDWHENESGSGIGWYSFSHIRLNGNYVIEQTSDGFRLTLTDMDRKIVLDFDKKLPE
jgi:hypothetical protein